MKLKLIGPCEAGIYKLNDRYRRVLYLKHTDSKILTAVKDQLEDYLNDNEMLAEADIGVAAANAHPETQKVAKYVGCAVEENLLAWVVKEIA